ncbi:MAG: hypothetical protein ACI9DC_000119 [Gammaproteobacteria bacterium]|jgi:hypothetical protein
MNEVPRFFELLITVVLAVAATTLLYWLLPFREWKNRKPAFTIFPKYVGQFTRPVDEVRATLVKLKFERQASGAYVRGKVYGDFSAKSIKVYVDIDVAKNEVHVGGAFFGVLFDSGDLWQLTSEILTGEA